MTEVFYILEGELIYLVGEETHNAPAGATLVIPPGTVHAFRNAQSQAARLLIIALPAGSRDSSTKHRACGHR
jgi:quercetin dioxygenase-like cupin family protein